MECSEHLETKLGQSNNFWVGYCPLKYVYKLSKIFFFSWITLKLLTFEYYAKNKTYSEVNFMIIFYFDYNSNVKKIDSILMDVLKKSFKSNIVTEYS